MLSIDPRWEQAIERCLRNAPGDRFARVEDLAAALTGELPTSAQRTRHRLPAELDSFIGREVELGELERRLDQEARLLTLVGPGGSGKTRLAVRLGWRTLGYLPGGVWFCELADARSPDGVAAAVATALEVPLREGDPTLQIAQALAARGPALFILDNFEQVTEHANATLGRWLDEAQQGRFLVTSRERLGLRGEELVAVPPLRVDVAVALFLERARTQRPDLMLDAAGLEAVHRVVRLLEGQPLAIELAAARVRVLAPGQIAQRIKDRFKLLADRTARGRHASLEAAIAWSWELLTPWEQAACTQCSVFDGSFTLEAAEEALDLAAWPEAPWPVDVIQALVDKSLLRVWSPEGQPAQNCFRMDASLRAYGRARLGEHGAVPGT